MSPRNPGVWDGTTPRIAPRVRQVAPLDAMPAHGSVDPGEGAARAKPSYTVTELNQQTAEVLRAVREDGNPAVITMRGRPIAVLSPLPDDIESQVMEQIRRSAGA